MRRGGAPQKSKAEAALEGLSEALDAFKKRSPSRRRRATLAARAAV